jgi:Ubiquitin-Binding Zinc Finger
LPSFVDSAAAIKAAASQLLKPLLPLKLRLIGVRASQFKPGAAPLKGQLTAYWDSRAGGQPVTDRCGTSSGGVEAHAAARVGSSADQAACRPVATGPVAQLEADAAATCSYMPGLRTCASAQLLPEDVVHGPQGPVRFVESESSLAPQRCPSSPAHRSDGAEWAEQRHLSEADVQVAMSTQPGGSARLGTARSKHEQQAKCPQCGARLALEQMQEHLDWHIACQVSSVVNGPGYIAPRRAGSLDRSPAQVPGHGKDRGAKRKASCTAAGRSRRPLDTFLVKHPG